VRFVDPTPHRISACPVHFVWDGRGHGRAFVRAGFLGFLMASGAALLASMLRIDVAMQVASALALMATASWLVGHALGLSLFNRPRADASDS
jgi:hypothetical protein